MNATPWGFRDILPEEALAREEIAQTVTRCFRVHGYLPVETPLLEDKGSLDRGGRITDTPFKLFDDDGRLLVVRPDNTLPIVRLVSTRLRNAALPLRLRYEAPLVRSQPRNAGAARQFTQLGFELIGTGGDAGDVEMVSLVIESLRALELPSWQLVCGSVRPFMGLLAQCADEQLAQEALALVHANNFVDLDARVAKSTLDEPLRRAISELPRLHGGIEVLDRVDELTAAAGIAEPLTTELRTLVARLGERFAADEESGSAVTGGDSAAMAGGSVAASGCSAAVTEDSAATDGGSSARSLADVLSFDFSIMNSFDYYTGLVCKVYAGNLPDPVGTGGRYDAAFDGVFPGRARVPAAGFAFSLERLESACAASEDAHDANADHAVARATEEPLRIAVPKGSLNEGTIAALEAVGLDVSGLRNPGRHLIVRSHDMRGKNAVAPSQPGTAQAGEPATDAQAGQPASGTQAGGSVCSVDEPIGDVEFIIVRATDAPAFVAGGGADCGFCGRDSLIEADLNLLELIDMHYGACRFIEAEPADRAGAAERAYARRGCLRVATKYPRIASAWYESRGIAADIVSLHGNIELGPIVGMTDRIVDITATGTTLRENNLVITGELMECTARFFVNPGRARLDRRVRVLADRLAAYAASQE